MLADTRVSVNIFWLSRSPRCLAACWPDYNSIPHGNTHTLTCLCAFNYRRILKLVLFSICLDFCLTRLGPEAHTHILCMCVFARLLNEISFWPYRKSIHLARSLVLSLPLSLGVCVQISLHNVDYYNNYNDIVPVPAQFNGKFITIITTYISRRNCPLKSTIHQNVPHKNRWICNDFALSAILSGMCTSCIPHLK